MDVQDTERLEALSGIEFPGSYGISVEKFNKIDAMVDVMLTCYAGEIAAGKGEMEIEQRNTSRNIDCNAKDSNFSDSEHG